MFFVTLLSLIYINMQMQIYDLAYKGKIREGIVKQLKESNGISTYNILKLKSANNLGCLLLDENSEMKFLDKSQIIRLPVAAQRKNNNNVALAKEQENKFNSWLNIFSLKSEAEARPQH
ncbi:MAG: hypothetical protein A2Z88_08020 [Omnitrophica WOR_2 bacterium GWA2_47_8]|nr:MAG: hypothetical protein A2Z88_08020 [Omnitrophica WOR_2 bacterium GWA2_47_8]